MTMTLPLASEIPTNTDVGLTLRAHRERRGITREELARAMTEVGVPTVTATLANIERGGRPIRLDEAVAVAVVFDLSMDVSAMTDYARQEAERQAQEADAQVRAAAEALAAAQRAHAQAQARLAEVTR